MDFRFLTLVTSYTYPCTTRWKVYWMQISSQPNSKPSVDSTISLLLFKVDLELALTVYIRFSNSAIFLMVSLHTRYCSDQTATLQIETYQYLHSDNTIIGLGLDHERNGAEFLLHWEKNLSLFLV